MNNKSGQATVFIIIAIALVVVIGGYFIIQNIKVTGGGIPENLQEVYTYYDECIRQDLSDAVYLVETQGGRVDPGIYIPGSEYAPFSSQLNFLGFPVPYWFYLSGNGVAREKVPTKQEIEKEVSDYIINNMQECDYESFYSKGLSINFGNPNVKVNINDNVVNLDVNSNVVVSNNESSDRKSTR